MKIVTPSYSFTFARSLALGTGCFIAALTSAQATDFTAIAGGAWDAVGTWTSDPDGFPTATDNVVGVGTNGINVTVNGSQAANNFTIDSSGSASRALNVLGGTGGALTINGVLTKSGGGDLTFRTSGTTLALTVGSISLSSGNLFLGTSTNISANRHLTSLSAGSTTVGTGSTLSLFVGANSATATVAALTVNGTGAVNIRQGSTNVQNTSGTLQVASLTGTGTVQVTSVASTGSTGTLAIASTSDASFAGVLANGSSGALSVTKSGSFTQTLSGASNTYSGGTTITEGTLLVTNISGSATGTGAVAVNGGTLGGTGFIAGATTVTGGNLAAGTDGTVGTLTFNGALDLAGLTGSGQLKFDLAAAGASDSVLLSSGALSIGSGVLNFDDFSFTTLAGFDNGVYTLLDTSTSITGTLGSSLSGVIAGHNAVLSTDGQDIFLTVTAGTIPEPSTYASLAGVMILGCAALRRRRQVV